MKINSHDLLTFQKRFHLGQDLDWFYHVFSYFIYEDTADVDLRSAQYALISSILSIRKILCVSSYLYYSHERTRLLKSTLLMGSNFHLRFGQLLSLHPSELMNLARCMRLLGQRDYINLQLNLYPIYRPFGVVFTSAPLLVSINIPEVPFKALDGALQNLFSLTLSRKEKPKSLIATGIRFIAKALSHPFFYVPLIFALIITLIFVLLNLVVLFISLLTYLNNFKPMIFTGMDCKPGMFQNGTMALDSMVSWEYPYQCKKYHSCSTVSIILHAVFHPKSKWIPELIHACSHLVPTRCNTAFYKFRPNSNVTTYCESYQHPKQTVHFYSALQAALYIVLMGLCASLCRNGFRRPPFLSSTHRQLNHLIINSLKEDTLTGKINLMGALFHLFAASMPTLNKIGSEAVIFHNSMTTEEQLQSMHAKMHRLFQARHVFTHEKEAFVMDCVLSIIGTEAEKRKQQFFRSCHGFHVERKDWIEPLMTKRKVYRSSWHGIHSERKDLIEALIKKRKDYNKLPQIFFLRNSARDQKRDFIDSLIALLTDDNAENLLSRLDSIIHLNPCKGKTVNELMARMRNYCQKLNEALNNSTLRLTQIT